MNSNILITGLSGQVGNGLQEIILKTLEGSLSPALLKALGPLSKANFVFCDRTAGPGVFGLDLQAPESEIFSTLDQVKPFIIINTSAWTNVDLAETKKIETFQVNAYGVESIAKWAEKHAAWLIHFSTDYVLDGSGDLPRNEDTKPSPLQVYGESKLLGEKLALTHCKRTIVLRTSWVYSHHGANFVKTMLRLGSEREEIRVIYDQIGAPTDAMILAEVSLRFAAGIIESANHSTIEPPSVGVYNVAAQGETNWFEFANEIFIGAKEREFPIILKRIIKIPTTDYPTPAKRPLNSRLDLSKVEKTLQIVLPHWKVGLTRVLNRLSPNSTVNAR